MSFRDQFVAFFVCHVIQLYEYIFYFKKMCENNCYCYINSAFVAHSPPEIAVLW